MKRVRIVSVRSRATLRVRRRPPAALPPNRVALPKPAKLAIDVVDFLLEERKRR
jgi:hypothetical protein